MSRQRSEILFYKNKPPDPGKDRVVQTILFNRDDRLDKARTQFGNQQNEEENLGKSILSSAHKEANNRSTSVYNHLKSSIFILNFLFFKFQTWTLNYRGRRRLSIRFFLLLLLANKLFSFWTQKSAQAVQIHQHQHQLQQQQQPQDQLEQQRIQSAFFEPPQPLVYLHESGSGEGPFAQSPSSNFKLSSSDSSQFSSSSVSPSLITAKCWNNYENDNDCKQINVITANNANDQQYDQNDNNDDSLITPVVIFESSSTLEPSSYSSNQQQQFQPPTFLAPPYFSSTFRPDSDNVVLARHRTPPTSNDLYSAPPATATILSPDSSSEVTQNSIYNNNWQTSTYSYSTQRVSNNKWQDNNNEGDAGQVVTSPTRNIFVATPQPKKAPKTTTLGRKCRDENDEDCDEPDEDDRDVNGDDNGRPGNGIRNRYKNNKNQDDDDDSRGNNNTNDQDIDDSSDNDNDDSSKASGDKNSSDTNNEIGSGDGLRDDSEGDDGDDDLDNVSDGSGNSEPTTINQTPKYVEVEGVNLSKQTVPNSRFRETKNGDDSSSSSVKPGARIEVYVHSTLPPEFTTTKTIPINYDTSQDIYSTKYDTQSTPTTTIMSDDTYTSKPVFPSSTSSESFGGDLTSRKNKDDDGSGAATDPNQFIITSTDLDLATFKPIPMPPVEISPSERWPNNKFDVNKNQSSSDGGGSMVDGGDTNKIPDKNKYDPASAEQENAVPIKFDNPWRAHSVQRPSFNQIDQLQQQQQQQQQLLQQMPQQPYSQQRPPSRHRPDPRASPSSSSSSHELNSPVNQVRMQSDILPTMLLYASIVILVVTALIFVIMAFALWRRNTARQRALLNKTQQQILNGSATGGGPNKVVGSLSHGSQLMANIQQPGLLSTYAPGKGLTMGKVTSSLMRNNGDNELNNMIGEEDEANPMLSSFDQQTKGDHQSLDDGSGNNLRDRSQAGTGANNGAVTGGGLDGVGTSSWSTDQDQTTTTSSGSQKTDLGQTGGGEQTNGGHLISVGQQNRQHYPNSLSDGRRNSSSASDSQCSPDEVRPQTSQPQFLPIDQTNCPPQQHHHPHQGPTNFTNGHNLAIDSPQNVHNPHHNQVIYKQQQAHTVIPDTVKLQQSQLKNKQQQHFISSRSVENLARNDGYPLDDNGQTICEPQPPPFHHQSPYLAQQSPRHRMINQILPPGQQQQPNLHRIQPPFKPPTMLPPMLIQTAYLPHSPGAQGTSLDGYPPINQQHINGNVRLTNGQHGPNIKPDFTHFNASNMNMARMSMNPVATLGRRYPAGMGLNRNIYSEDSSSLMTASPSLARTSSSLSFAFSANNQPSTPSIQAKPLVDASGRVYNDYTQVNYSGANNGAPPPVLGRKDRSEAWYV